MTAAKRPNLAKLRASVKAAALPGSDVAGVELAATLAELIDAAGDMGIDSRVEILKVLGPTYLRTLTALGLTKAGRGVGDSAGKPGGRPAGEPEHQRHRERFQSRRHG